MLGTRNEVRHRKVGQCSWSCSKLLERGVLTYLIQTMGFFGDEGQSMRRDAWSMVR